MKKKVSLNPLTGKFDIVNHLPQFDSDPASPAQEDAWVYKSAGYEFSFRTKEGTTVRFALS